jgi:hypothetical protein
VGIVIAARWTYALALLTLGAALLCGCSETMPLAQLPDAAKVPERVLSKAEQQGKVQQMIEKGRTHRSEATREIEEDRDR